MFETNLILHQPSIYIYVYVYTFTYLYVYTVTYIQLWISHVSPFHSWDADRFTKVPGIQYLAVQVPEHVLAICERMQVSCSSWGATFPGEWCNETWLAGK
jgi:hypothetical protein